MSKRRKQPRSEFFSVEDLRKEAEEEIDQEAVGAKILNDINSIDLKGIGDLPMEVILCVLIVKFGLAVVCAMSSVISSLSVLPANVRHEVFAMLWPDLLEDNANVLFQSVSKLKLPNVKTDRKFHVFTPPIGHCFHCKSALVRYNKPVKVKVHGLSGTSDGVKVSRVIHFMVTQDLALHSKDGICIPIREKWLKRQMCVLWIEFCYSGKYL